MATYYTKWSFSNSTSPNGANYTVDGVKVTYYNDVRYKFVTSESTSKSTNKSTFTVKKYVCFYYTWPNAASSLSINMRSRMPSGGTYQSDTKTISATRSQTYQLVGTDTFTISHNVDGTGTTSFNGYGTYTGGSGTVYTRSATKTGIDMTTINRSSSITSDATSTTKFGDTINFTISPYNNNFTHDISYSMEGQTGTIATSVGTNTSWEIPTSLVPYTPNNSKPNIIVTCVTKSGTTTIGSQKLTISVNVPSEYVLTPTLALEEVGDVPLEWGVWLTSKSKVKGTITTTPAIAGDTAIVKSIVSKSNEQTFTINPFTTGYLLYDGERTVLSTITDSRGRTSTASQTISVLEYYSPVLVNCYVERCLQDGTLNEDGTYGKATIEYDIYPVNNGTTDLNAKQLKVTIGATTKSVTPTDYSGAYTFTELFSGLDTKNTYTALFEVIDQFYSDDNSIRQTATINPSFITESYLAGGKGITHGRVAIEEGIHEYMDVEHHNNTKVKNININDWKSEVINGILVEYKVGE